MQAKFLVLLPIWQVFLQLTVDSECNRMTLKVLDSSKCATDQKFRTLIMPPYTFKKACQEVFLMRSEEFGQETFLDQSNSVALVFARDYEWNFLPGWIPSEPIYRLRLEICHDKTLNYKAQCIASMYNDDIEDISSNNTSMSITLGPNHKTDCNCTPYKQFYQEQLKVCNLNDNPPISNALWAILMMCVLILCIVGYVTYKGV